MVGYDFTGQSVIITGGAGGIGLELARRFHAAGAWVCLWDNNHERVHRAAEGIGTDRVSASALDITAKPEIEAAVAGLLAQTGRVDVLVNSAGITGPNDTVAQYDADAWRRVIDVNLNGTFLCCQAVLPAMQKADYGRIVNIASIAGKEGNPNAAAYSASKAGVLGLTKSLGKELAGTGIRVNAVTPAVIKTEIFDQMTQQHIDYMLSKVPMGRFGTVEEAAKMCLWLSSGDCSFSTGAVFDISGGRATY
ncbi:SDR family NAD(P)-dependent oxidoreductase [Nitratireductor sp. StC3]|uniref:SDR family NAD(P)-dependent oxidoreductase n=1 Tax=Nitratireductor sp. StC3 TaxID=2126741 RepID=UPI000D0C9B1E|nr:SDR family NAD(P)-dependent oxidoreductase [Nitratireductor sp. StC3]PSM20386.1 3-oxoacyl-ACP reductase [Nitratireductor sp. StC3]